MRLYSGRIRIRIPLFSLSDLGLSLFFSLKIMLPLWETMHKHNAKVSLALTLFAKCESCIDHFDDDGNVKEKNDVMKTYFDVMQSVLIGRKIRTDN